MLGLVVSAVVFVGIGGAGAKKVDKQVGALLQKEADVGRAKVTDKQRLVLARHGKGARAIVEKLDADGVIAGELVRERSGKTLHIILYGGDGGVKDMLDVPLSGAKLGKSDLKTLRATVVDGAIALANDAQEPVAEEVAAPVEQQTAAVEREDPLGGGGGDTAASLDERAPVRHRRRGTWLRVAAGGGVVQRTMASGLADVPNYESRPVGAVQVDAEVRPLRFVAVSGELERTVALESDLASGPAPTSITRWQGAVAVVLARGGFEIAPLVGYGHRAFVIEATGARPLPDGRFSYAVLGARVRAPLGKRLALVGFAAYEPGVSGADATEMAYQPEGRSAVEAAGGIELRAMAHVFVRARADFHRFAWTWTSAGVTGAATDVYTGGTLSVGATY